MTKSEVIESIRRAYDAANSNGREETAAKLENLLDQADDTSVLADSYTARSLQAALNTILLG